MIGPIRNRLDISVLQDQTLVAFLQNLRILSADRIQEILVLGAVYVNYERLTADRSLKRGDGLRVHLSPRRFAVGTIDWKKLILNETAEFIAIHKPVNIPTHPTCDNILENVIAQLRLHLKIPLWIVHRLDFETAGVMVLAKTKEYANTLRAQFENREMEKLYLCRVEKPLACKDYIHYIDSSGLAPYLCSDTEKPGWKRCELSILRCEQDPVSRDFHLKILLKTGRHHQIRSQLSHLGSPLIGDQVYGSKRYGLPLLIQTRLAKKGGVTVYGNIDHMPYGSWSSRLLYDPIQ